MRTRQKKPKWQTDIAEERIEILFNEAEKEFPSHPERSDKYVSLARRIAMRYTVRIPAGLRMRFCRKCYKYLTPNVNATATHAGSAIKVACRSCGYTRTYARESKNGERD